jgi:hypothetical protein
MKGRLKLEDKIAEPVTESEPDIMIRLPFTPFRALITLKICSDLIILPGLMPAVEIVLPTL